MLNSKIYISNLTKIIASTLFVISLLSYYANCAELKVFPLFTEHGILQQDTKVNIWGKAPKGTDIAISFRGMTATAVADENGDWLAELQTPKAETNQEGTDLTISSKNEKIILNDVLVGEIWLGSGQSNLDGNFLPLRSYEVGKKEIPNADYPQIRLYNAAGGKHKGDYSKYKWRVCSPEVLQKEQFSAAGYFFSRDLHKQLKVPVGFIDMAVGASPLFTWVEKEWLLEDDRAKNKFEVYVNKTYPDFITGQRKRISDWEEAVKEAEKNNKKTPKRPWTPQLIPLEQYMGCHYRTHIKPIGKFTLKGILWDQGESAIAPAYRNIVPYDVVFDIMVKKWRGNFGQNLPFVYCQMPKGGAWGPTVVQIDKKTNMMGESVKLEDLPTKAPIRVNAFKGYATEQDPFMRMLIIPECYMAVTRDLNHALHPPDKDSYGNRFFLTASKMVYSQNLECYGPKMKEAKVSGNKISISFENIDGGLVALGGKELQGFFVIYVDPATGKTASVWPKCSIDGEQVILEINDGIKPKSVSYADTNFGRVMWANLFNKAGLPAYPMTLTIPSFK